MKTKIKKEILSVIGFLFVILAGTLLHFAFDASGGSTLVGAFTPVNESIWEHLKLLLFPVLAFAVIEYFVWGKDTPSFIPAKIYGALLGLLFIVAGYYTYSGILGKRFLAADIALLFVASALSSLLSLIFSERIPALKDEKQAILALLLLTVIILSFIYFTFHPPMLELFRDPVTEDFGISAVIPYVSD